MLDVIGWLLHLLSLPNPSEELDPGRRRRQKIAYVILGIIAVLAIAVVLYAYGQT